MSEAEDYQQALEDDKVKLRQGETYDRDETDYEPAWLNENDPED